MRVAEILAEEEHYLKEMESFILDLLVAFRANRIGEVDLDKLVRDVRSAGFPAIDKDFMVDFLGRTSWVDRVDPETDKIFLKLHDGDTEEDMAGLEGELAAEDPDAAETKVSDDAMKVADKAMKDK